MRGILGTCWPAWLSSLVRVSPWRPPDLLGSCFSWRLRTLTACYLRQGCSLSNACVRVKAWWGPPLEVSLARDSRQMLWSKKATDSYFCLLVNELINSAPSMAGIAVVFAFVFADVGLHDQGGSALSAPSLVFCCSALVNACAACAAALVRSRAIKLHALVHPGGGRLPIEQDTLDRLTALLAEGVLDKIFTFLECVLAWAKRGLLFGSLLFGVGLMLMPIYLVEPGQVAAGWVYAAMGLGWCAFFVLQAPHI